MEARVYTIASGKGGTGKTTIAINLGTALAMCSDDVKIIIVDADVSMANIGLALGLEESPITLNDVLTGNADVRDAMYEGYGGVQILPSSISLDGPKSYDAKKLPRLMNELHRMADFILIDSPPGVGRESTTPLSVADEILLVVNPELTSVVDAIKIRMLAERYESAVGGVILNRADASRSELPVSKVEELLDLPILQVIPEDVRVKKAALVRMPVVVRSPNSPAARAFRGLATSLFEREFGKLEEKRLTEKLKDLFKWRV
jgi:septum site-determining protein MinD